MDDTQVRIGKDDGNSKRIERGLEGRGSHALQVKQFADRDRALKVRDQQARRLDFDLSDVTLRRETDKRERPHHGRIPRKADCQNVVDAKPAAPLRVDRIIRPLRSVSQLRKYDRLPQGRLGICPTHPTSPQR